MLDHDLIVVGGGYWGTAVAFEARLRGLDAVVLDTQDPQGGSRNASGIVHPKTYSSPLFKKYMPDDWTKEDLLASFEWLKTHCGATPTVEHFYNHTRPDLGVRELPQGLYLKDNDSLLSLVEPIPEEVTKLVRGESGNWIVNGSRSAPRLVIAAGIHTDKVLDLADVLPVGVKALFGRGLAVVGKTKLPSPLVVQTRPYRKFETRTWSEDVIRIGDTAELRPDEAKYRAELAQVADWLVPNNKVSRWFEGYRPVCEKFTVRLVAPGLVAATGGHRMGLGLSGLVAFKTLDLLK